MQLNLFSQNKKPKSDYAKKLAIMKQISYSDAKEFQRGLDICKEEGYK